MHGFEPAEQLDADREHLVHRRAAAREPLVERLPDEPLHDEEGLAGLRLPDLEQAHDVRVPHGRERDRFAQEALPRHRVARARERRFVHFRDRLEPAGDVPNGPDAAHGADPDEALDPVAAGEHLARSVGAIPRLRPRHGGRL